MSLQNVDHPTVHRPMSLLLQALKQIEQKAPAKSAVEPPAARPRDLSGAWAKETPSPAAGAAPTPQGNTIELIRQYDASETATEIALAGPVHVAAVPLLAPPAQSEPKSMTHDGRRRRRFADEVLKLLPHENRAVIALVPVEGAKVWPVLRELCRGLVGQADGDVLAVAQNLNPASRESPGATRFSDLLSGREGWQSAVHRDEEGFFILERGDDRTIAASNGRSLLKLWQELNRQFAYVVIDAGLTEPPAVTSLVASCDGAFAVVGLERTDRREVERLIARIRSLGGRACGCLVVD